MEWVSVGLAILAAAGFIAMHYAQKALDEKLREDQEREQAQQK